MLGIEEYQVRDLRLKLLRDAKAKNQELTIGFRQKVSGIHGSTLWYSDEDIQLFRDNLHTLKRFKMRTIPEFTAPPKVTVIILSEGGSLSAGFKAELETLIAERLAA